MLSILDHQRNRLKNMVYARIAEDFEDDYPANINRVRREEESGADIQYLYGELFKKVYKMMVELRSTIENSSNPYEDPIVHVMLEKYNYYISPTGCHIYGAGPKF